MKHFFAALVVEEIVKNVEIVVYTLAYVNKVCKLNQATFNNNQTMCGDNITIKITASFRPLLPKEDIMIIFLIGF